MRNCGGLGNNFPPGDVLRAAKWIQCKGKGDTMLKLMSCGAAIAFAASISVGPTQAAMYPISPSSGPQAIPVDCAVGFHIGPAGACVLGTEERHDRVIEERRATDEGCATHSVNRTDAAGNSETHTTTNCD